MSVLHVPQVHPSIAAQYAERKLRLQRMSGAFREEQNPQRDLTVRPKTIAFPTRQTPAARYEPSAGDETAWEFEVCGLTPKRSITVKEIIETVASYYSVTVVDIASARRTMNIMIPRQAVMYLARELTGLSLPQIGARLGNRDHTTILHGIRKMQKRINSDASIAEAISNIRARLMQLERAHV